MPDTDTFANLIGALNDRVPYLAEIVGLVITWTIVMMLVRHFHNVLQALDQRSRRFHMEDRALAAFDKILDTFFYTLGIFVSLLILGITGALYAGLTAFGVIGLIIGFAGRELISNILAGFVLVLDSPFVIGDSIEVGGFAGTVKRLSLRSCEVQQGDGRYIVLPNSYLTGKPILNNTKNPVRRVQVSLALMKEAEIPRAIHLSRELAEGLQVRLDNKPVDILVNKIEEGAVELLIRFWVARVDFTSAHSEATLKLTQMCKAEGLELAVTVYKNV